MAVQKSKKSRAKRDSRRSANSKLSNLTLSSDDKGLDHIRHHVTEDQMGNLRYRGRIIKEGKKVTEEE